MSITRRTYLGSLHEQKPELQSIPGWTGFNQLLSTVKPQVTVVGPLPIVNAPAHEFETLWTVILRCKAMTHLRNGKFTVITMDEGLYNKAKMLYGERHKCSRMSSLCLDVFTR